nr:ASKHA domain-containing protein [uncultured Holophaga sp.]
MDHCTVVFKPHGNVVSVPVGQTTREALYLAGLSYDFPCGGNGKCGKCRVQVEGGTSEPTDQEQLLLSRTELEQGVRLACHTRILQDAEVLLMEGVKQSRILTQSIERKLELLPVLSKHYVELPPPHLEDQRSDYQRLKDALCDSLGECRTLRVSLGVLKKLSAVLREADFKVTAILQDDELCGVEKHDTTAELLGMAFDIGTTTVVGYLLDLRTGRELCHVSALNPQTRFGGDVISRTAYSNQKNGLEELHLAVVETVNRLIETAASRVGKGPGDIYALSFAGNTCMHHLFLGLSPRHIALVPYVPVVNEALVLDPAQNQLVINPAGRAFLFPNIAGYVGGDTVAVVLATEMDRRDHMTLAIDIGTNGEMVLGTRQRLLACSTAAGPAFEGAQISSGMRGADGAIDHVRFGESLEYSVIGEVRPKGICGSGLIDLVAGLLELGIINKPGKILPPERIDNPAAAPFLARLVTHENMPAFLLVPGEETSHGRPILLTQGDVRALQAAKGAIAAGVKILCGKQGITLDEVKEVVLAGAFGNYMDPHNACLIGLIPMELDGRITMVGNAAGAGAKMALLSRSEFARTAEIARVVDYIELGAQKDFNTVFAYNTRF